LSPFSCTGIILLKVEIKKGMLLTESIPYGWFLTVTAVI
jgi:hypothetical protein